MAQTIGLTGATGFVGRTLLNQLLGHAYPVRALVRQPGRLSASAALEEIHGSLEDSAALKTLVRGCHTVVHVAGAIAGRDYADFARVNSAGSARLVQALEQHNPGCRLIMISSLAAREPGLSDYALSKRAGELVVESSLLDWIILRPPAVYGPLDPALAPLWRGLARGWLLRAGPAQARFSLLHADDLARAILVLLERSVLGCRSGSLHDGRDRGYSWADVASIAEAVSGRRIRTLPVPRSALSLVAQVNQGVSRLSGQAPILGPGKVRELNHVDWVCDNTLLEDIPGWAPAHQLEQALPTLPGWSRLTT